MRRLLSVVGLAPVLVAAIAAACGDNTTTSGFGPSDDAGGGGSTDSAYDSCAFCGQDAGDGNVVYDDFPNPILDAPDGGAAAPSNAPALFGPPSQGAQSGGPCLIEPEVGSLYPKNWLRPRFKWIAASGENLFELRVHAANQHNDLLVYTTGASWTMPQALWDALRGHSSDVAMSVVVRGGVYAGGKLTDEATGSIGPIGIAPVEAPGSIVYWTTSNGTWLKGFSIGDDNVGNDLQPSQVQEFSTSCIGCHTSTPDGKFASFNSSGPSAWQNGLGDIEQGKEGQVPPWLGAAGKAAIEQTQMGINTFSKAHWATGDRIEVTRHDPADDGNADLVWIDLEAQSGTAMGTIARNGDPRHAGAPSWSHDGNTIAYVSTDANRDGRLDDGEADVYLVPYNDKAGGSAKPLAGASTAGPREYYPTFSPDDAWIAFDKAASGNMYNNDGAEVFVVPAGGGTATRLAANDPPKCTGKTSPGVTNSWPKWAPSVGKPGDGRQFYWIVFSSRRNPNANPQLYVTGVVVGANSVVTTHGALYLWNQPEGESNHTPAWDNFAIPPPPPK